MRFFKSKSAILSLCVFLCFSFYYSKQIKKVTELETTCVCAYDGFGYYMYLPFFMEHGHLKMTQKWAQSKQDEYCGGTYAYQIVKTEKGEIDVYHMGQAFVEAPAFLVGHVFAKALEYKADGFSKPYHIAFLLNSLLFIGLGIYFFRKLMLLFFKENVTSILILLCFSGTNYWIMATLSPTMTHHYLFAVIAGFAYFFFKSVKGFKINKRAFIISCIFFGLAVVIRPTNAMLGIVPGLVLLQRLGFSKEFWRLIILFPIAAFVWNIPQIYYWKTAGDSWIITNLHTEDLTLFDPYTWKFLFSYRKGWLLYTPLFLLLIPTLIYLFRKNRKYFYVFGALIFVVIWVVSSWECWWYSDSLGQRPMVDVYSLLFIPIGLFLVSLRSQFTKVIVGVFAFFCVMLNIFQSYQMTEGIMHTYLMSKEQYWHIWGKTSREEVTDYRLLITRADTLWPQRIEFAKDPHLTLKSSEWLKMKNIDVQPNSTVDIKHLPFSDFETDEVLLTVNMSLISSDTAQVPLLLLQAAGKHNCYSWDVVEMRVHQADTLVHIQKSFNIPDVRHAKDYLQVYITNPTTAKVKVEELKITATQLIRK